MGEPQIKIDENALDNGSWRKVIGKLAMTTDDSGKVRTVGLEFLIEASTAAEINSRFTETYEAFCLKNPRIRAWYDDGAALPAIDWFPGIAGDDGLPGETVCVITQMPERSETTRKLHCVLIATCLFESAVSPSGHTGTALGNKQGLLTEVELVKEWFDGRRYTLSAHGTFGASYDDDALGPFTLTGVTNNGGKARFAFSSATLPALAEGMRLEVGSGSTYQGSHIITAINDTTDVIDTLTTYEVTESSLTVACTIGTVTSGEANYQAARSSILTELLETGTNGVPASASPHMALLSEKLAYNSERQDVVEFNLVSGPQSLASGVTTGGAPVERGLSYAIKFNQPELWDDEHAPAITEVLVAGKFALTEDARTADSLYSWWSKRGGMRDAILSQLNADTALLGSGILLLRQDEVDIDYTTNDVRFGLAMVGNYTGTLAYGKHITYSSKKAYTIFEDTDGYDHVQYTKSPPRKMASVTVTWTGDGAAPGQPSPPSEAGYQWLYDSDTLLLDENLVGPSGRDFRKVVREWNFIRVRQRDGGGTSGGTDGGSYGGPSGSGKIVDKTTISS